MRHRRKNTKLSRNRHQRQRLFKQLLSSLIINEQLKTTEAKAKVIVGLIDKLMTQAKQGSLSARRRVWAFLNHQKAVHKLFDDLAVRAKDRFSGFSRMVRLGRRRGDNAMIARVELVDKPRPKADKK